MVYLPKGTYAISGKLTITKPPCGIVGDGPESSFLRYSGGSLTTSDYLINVGTAPEGTNRFRPFVLRDFTLATNDSAGFGQSQPRGVHLYDTHTWVIERMHFRYLNVPLQGESCWTGHLRNCVLYDNWHGVHFQHAAHNVTVQDCNFLSIRAAHPQAFNLVGYLFFRFSRAVTITGCDFELDPEGNVVAGMRQLFRINAQRLLCVSY